MIVILTVAAYLIIGIVTMRLYYRRDIENTRCIQRKIHEYVQRLNLRTEEASCFLYGVLEQSSIDNAGWWYWRRKKPFDRLSMKMANTISFPFWIIDIAFCEIGFCRELQYVNKLNHLLRKENEHGYSEEV